MNVFKKAQIRFMLIPILVCALLLLVVFGAIFSIAINSSVTNAQKSCKISLNRNLSSALENPFTEKCLTLIVMEDGEVLVSKSNFFGDFPVEDVPNEIESTNHNIVKIGDVAIVAEAIDDIYQDLPVKRYAIYDFTAENLSVNTLGRTLLIVYFITLAIIGVLSYIFSASAVEPLKVAFRKQQDLIANASHELKTPLTIAATNLDLVASDMTAPDNEKWINSARYQIDRMNSLVLQMLELTKLETQKRTLDKENVNISNLCEGIALTFDAAMYEKGIDFNEDIKKDIFYECDKIEMEKLITILLDNANKYTSENGKIEFNLYKEAKSIKIDVKNYGTGLNKDDLNKVFERFYKTDLSHKEAGNSFGLGLSIAKSLSEVLGGELICDSDGESWTLFSLILPYKQNKEK